MKVVIYNKQITFMKQNQIPATGTFWQSSKFNANYMYLYMYIFSSLTYQYQGCSFKTIQNLLVRFDENTDTDQLFVWNKVQVKNNKLQDLKELFLQKRNMSTEYFKNIPNITNNIFFFLNTCMHVNKLKNAFKHVHVYQIIREHSYIFNCSELNLYLSR